jgi:hypothetical protein
MRIIFVIALTFVTALAVAAQANAAENWKSFKSSTGFTLEYPGNWFRIGVSPESLSILSSRGGAEGVIITDGQGLINASEEPKFRNLNLSQLIDYYTKWHEDLRVLSRRSIRNENAGSQGCRNLLEVVSKEPIVSPEDVRPKIPPNIINTEFFCEMNGRKYVIVLRNFEGDKKQASFQQTALRLAESIRVDQAR